MKFQRSFACSGVYPGDVWAAYVTDVAVPFRLVDVAHLRRQEDAVRKDYRDNIERDVDFSSPPHLRAVVYRLNPTTHTVICFVNHLVCDRMSLLVVQRDLRRWYQFLSGWGEPPSTPPLSFGECLRALGGRDPQARFQRDADFWRQHWAEHASARIMPHELDPPSAAARDEKQKPALAECATTLGADRLEALRYRAAASGVTLFTLFVAVVLSVLRRNIGRSHLSLWINLANRSVLGSEDVVGQFVNQHLIGFDLTGLGAADVVGRVGESLSEAIAHQRLPLSALWHALRCRPLVGDAQVLVDMAFGSSARRDWKDEGEGAARVRGTEAPRSVSPRFSTFGFYATVENDGLIMAIQYRGDRYCSAKAERLLEQVSEGIVELSVSGCLQGWSLLAEQPRPDDARSQFVMIAPEALRSLTVF